MFLTVSVLVEILLLFFFVVQEMDFQAVASLAIFGLVTHYFGGVDYVAYVRTHGVMILEFAAAYLVSGAAWSVVKWFFFCRDLKQKYLGYKADYFRHHVTGTPAQSHSYATQFTGDVPPSAQDHKSQIVSWIGYWPVSLIWTLLDDFLTKVFKEIYNVLSGVFQRIANSQFKDIEK